MATERKLRHNSVGFLVAAISVLWPSQWASAAALTPDLNFRAPRFVQPSPGGYITPLPGGKYLQFSGTDAVVGKPVIGALARFLADGTVDPSFRFTREYSNVTAMATLPNGKLIVAASRTLYGDATAEEIVRLNADGSIDETFDTTTVASSFSGRVVRGLLILENGKILVTGFFRTFGNGDRPGIVRLLAGGGVDSSFAVVPLLYFGGPGSLGTNHHVVVQPDGKIIIFGSFDQIGADSFPGLARLNADGTVDLSFQPSGFTAGPGRVRCATVQGDGKIIVGGSSLSVPSTFASNPTGATAKLPLVRLDTNGTADEGYGYFGDPSGFFSIRDLILQPDGKALAADGGEAATLRRFNLNGTADPNFHQPIFKYIHLPGNSGAVPNYITRRSDGRLLVSGSFTDVDTASLHRSNLGVVRLNANGTVDRSLKTKDRTGQSTFPGSAARLASGSTYVGFNTLGSGDTPVPNNFARLGPKGAVDSSFNPFVNAGPNAPLQSDFLASDFVRLGDGKLFISGTEGAFGKIAYGRLLPNGTQDLTFEIDPAVPPLFDSSSFLFVAPRALVLPNNAVLFGSGDAQAIVNGGALIRLTQNGSLDGSFHLPPTIKSQLVIRASGQIAKIRQDAKAVAVQPDGKILFVYLHTDTACRLVRLKADGSIDGTFAPVTLVPLNTYQDFPAINDPQTGQSIQPANGAISAQAIASALVQGDKRIVIAGPFKSINGKAARGIARLNPNGSIDPSFKPGSGPTWTSITETAGVRPLVEQVEQQANGKLLITGTFEAFKGVSAPGIASLNANGTADNSFVPPAIRQKEYFNGSVLERQPDGSFLLSGPYSYPDETLAPSLLRLLPAP